MDGNYPFAEKGHASFRDVLKNRNFVKLWVSQIGSQISYRMVTLALIISVFQTTKSNISVVFLIFAFAIPALIFGLPAGAYVDRHSRKRILIITNFLQAITILALLLTKDVVWLVLFVIFVYSAINQLYIPSETSTIPNLVEDRNLLAANSLFMFTVYGSYIIGYGLAGPMMYLFGNDSPFILGGALLLIAAFSCVLLPSDKHHFKNIKMSKIYKNVWYELKEAYEFIISKKNVLSAVIKLTLIQALLGILVVLIPSFSQNILKIDIRTASVIFITPVVLGTVVGALMVSKMSKRIKISRLVKGSIIADGLIIILVGALYPIGKFIKTEFGLPFLNNHALLIVFGVLVTFLGIVNSLIVISSQTELQRETPNKIRGRVFGVFGMFVSVAALLPMLFLGALADFISVTNVFILAGILVTIYGIFSSSNKILDIIKNNH